MSKPTLKVVSEVSDTRQNGQNQPLRPHYGSITPKNYTDDIENEYIKAAKAEEEKAKKQAVIIAKAREEAINLLKAKRVISLVLEVTGTDQAAIMAYVSGMKSVALELVPGEPVTLSEIRALMDKLSDRQVNTKASQLLQDVGLIVKTEENTLRFAIIDELKLAAGCHTRRITHAVATGVRAGGVACKVGVAHLAGCITQSPYVTIDKTGNVTRHERFEQTDKGKEARRRLDAAKRDEDLARKEMQARRKAAQMRNDVDPYMTTGQWGSAKGWMWGAGIIGLLAVAASVNQPANNQAGQFPSEPAKTQQIEHGE
ncbi:hypothetical protein VSS37_03265 [Candidatus Thiothrix sp. Deng01]|uniref:Uncharacterized protein n=1 Tax=Candidatus Thiothrix phosphatis TaxID=3112415 RepID=A0ABU6CT65_9GAMM|nr:hypothetical protein [Candidatus Thiothrix sp. Deng01]MEB4589989.1 hypothetical protein [Candidatus Thiothrix sp. Deng01]